VITGGGGDGISLAADDKNFQVIGNVTSANHGAGIEVLSEAEGTLLRNNRAHENGADDPSVAGIIIADPAGVEDPDLLIDNAASRNGFLSETTGDDIGLGIDAASDTSASSRDNVARGNDNTAECTQLNCS
jgi:parallel beta-helix repeat protein